MAIFFMNAIIYLCTPNIAFLVNGQSFARQMMPASALILLALVLTIRWNGSQDDRTAPHHGH
jgi:ABC-type Fe3+-siderophore transport system permease subunit